MGMGVAVTAVLAAGCSGAEESGIADPGTVNVGALCHGMFRDGAERAVEYRLGATDFSAAEDYELPQAVASLRADFAVSVPKAKRDRDLCRVSRKGVPGYDLRLELGLSDAESSRGAQWPTEMRRYELGQGVVAASSERWAFLYFPCRTSVLAGAGGAAEMLRVTAWIPVHRAVGSQAGRVRESNVVIAHAAARGVAAEFHCAAAGHLRPRPAPREVPRPDPGPGASK